MPIRFEKYRFTKRTPLSDEVFNRIFQDIDLRIASLEDIKKDWQTAVDQLISLGLSRIDLTLRPSLEQMEELRLQAQNKLDEIITLRQNADAMINQNRDDAIQAVNTAKTDALNAISQARQSAVNELQLSKFLAFFGG